MFSPIGTFKKWRAHRRLLAEVARHNAIAAETEKRRLEKKARYDSYVSNYSKLSRDERHSLRDPGNCEEYEAIVDSPYFANSEKEARTIAAENRIIEHFSRNGSFEIKYQFVSDIPGGLKVSFCLTSVRQGFEYPALAWMILNNSSQIRNITKDDDTKFRKDSPSYAYAMCKLLALSGGKIQEFYDGITQDSPGAFTMEYHRFKIKLDDKLPDIFEDDGNEQVKEYIMIEIDIFMRRWPTDRITRKLRQISERWPP